MMRILLLLSAFPVALPMTAATHPRLAAAQPGATPPPIAANPTLDRLLPFGQPAYYRIELGTQGGYAFGAERPTARILIDLEGRVVAPQFGLLDVSLEGSILRAGRKSRGTIGASLKLPIVRGGLEYDAHEDKPYVKLTLEGAPRRGGILARGDRLRLDYIPAKRMLELGLKMPAPWSGYRETRPRNAFVAVPRGTLPTPTPVQGSLLATDKIERVRHAMEWIDRLLTPNLTPRSPESRKGRRAFEREAAALNEHARMPGHSFASEDSAYHAGLRAAFATAGGGDEAIGETLATHARGILLHDVIIPYDRLLGRMRSPGEITGLLATAHSHFQVALESSDPKLGAAERQAALEVFRQVLDELDHITRASRRRWQTWRLVWIPLNFGLRPEAYDSQREVDAILGDVVGQSFSSANSIRYSLNDEFYQELLRSVHETRCYHVLWIHDYSGRNGTKGPDRVAWTFALNGYLDAFVSAIQEMDRGERSDLPQFFILLDEFYYRGNGSEQVMTFLEQLATTDAPHLSDKSLEASVREGLTRLRKAISASSAMKRLGDRYVRRHVRVQIAITHPYDPTFIGDMLMRDHTKLAFRDVFEEDPSSGELMLTGLGVGEHYVGPAWEDRSLIIRGTEMVRIKTAARELLVSQGVRPDEIPYFLRARPYPKSFDQTCDSLRAAGWTASVLATTNGTGYRDKSASVLKAALYNLMQRGSVLLAPDSLWTNEFWAAMFVSAALRGCHAFPIAPASDHAPSSALPTLGLMHRALWILFRSSEILRESIDAAGGTLRVGIYTKEDDVEDVRALVGRILEKECRGSPLRGWVQLHPRLVDVLRQEYDRMQAEYDGPTHPQRSASAHKPFLHLKAQFFASGAALSILGRADWTSALRQYIDTRCKQSLKVPGEKVRLDATLTRSAIPEWPVLEASAGVRDASSAPNSPDWEKVVVISTLGSQNQDRRSMLLDGEVLSATAGEHCLPAMIDFAFLMGAATWPEKVEDLDGYFPKTSGFLRKISRFLRDLI